jgi:hypothetical protein
MMLRNLILLKAILIAQPISKNLLKKKLNNKTMTLPNNHIVMKTVMIHMENKFINR